MGRVVHVARCLPGGITQYSGTVHEADGTLIPFPGSTLRPFVVGNSGDVVGAQIVQSFVQDIFSPTGDEIPEVFSVRLDVALPFRLTHGFAEAGEHDVEGDADAGLAALVGGHLVL